MKSTHFKTILREIRQSFGRFAAIIAIVALGTGFLVGLLSSTPDMKHTVNTYYQDQSMSDFNIKSTMGMTEEDRDALEAHPDVKTVMPAQVMDDKMVTQSGETLTGRIYGFAYLENEVVPENDIRLNNLTLTKGRLPQKKGECLLQQPNAHRSQLSIGDTLTLDHYDKDTYACKTFTIVGIVTSPYYFCNEKEPSNVGNGRVGAILYTGTDAFSLDVYTDFFLTLKQSASYDTFSEDYTDYIETTTDSLKVLADKRCKARYDSLRSDAEKEVQDARDELATARLTAEAELADALAELEQGQRELEDGKRQITNAKEEVAQGQNRLNTGRKELQQSKKQLNAAEKQIREAKEAQQDAQASGMPLPPEAQQQMQAQIKQYETGVRQYEAGMAQVTQQQKQLDTASREIAANEATLQNAEGELQSGQQEYKDAQAEMNREFADAEAEIRDAEKEIAKIKMPEWYLLDRTSNVSFSRYKIDVQKVADIATVFPIFFFLVAALVSLTTMTRMVEEERTQIGTLKALGYSKGKIMSKYMSYCGVATLIGCGLGLAIGIHLLPAVIFKAYQTIYRLPDLTFQWHWLYIASACLLEAACTMGATWFACRQSLREKPAFLMLPRAPKAGKRILLERIKPIWNRLSFTHKATARNIFRYKKHLFMTVIGIAGCTALMLTGLGLRDSMSNLTTTQFDEIFHYDMAIRLSDDAKERKDDRQLQSFLRGKDALPIHQEAVTVRSAKNDTIAVTMQVPKDPKIFSSMVTLIDRPSGKPVAFREDSVILSEKLADDMGIAIGDAFEIKDGDEKTYHLTLTGTTENYVGCYLYLGAQTCREVFGSPNFNGYLIKSSIDDLKEQDRITTALTDTDAVSSVTFTTQERASYETILSSVNFIVLVLIFCAGALAVVVLYNLTNININERTKELATLRVLGYYQGEVARYVFREIALLTLLGTLVGLIVGMILHRYVVLTAENTNMMLGREIEPLSFFLAAILTIIFSVIVDLLMLFKLRKIEMVESMKAVD